MPARENEMQERKTRVTEIKYLTENILELAVDLVEPNLIDFQPGQYMGFRFGKFIKSYSIISRPENRKKLKFCIELLPGGIVSTHVKNLKVADELLMDGPWGTFTVNNFEMALFFVATGVGIAPFVSLVPEILAKGYNKSLQLLFGVRGEQDAIYFDFFNQIESKYQNFKFTPILSRPGQNWTGERGRVTTYLDGHYENYRNYLFYICGGVEMVKDARTLLLKNGHSLKDIKMEIFV